MCKNSSEENKNRHEGMKNRHEEESKESGFKSNEREMVEEWFTELKIVQLGYLHK